MIKLSAIAKKLLIIVLILTAVILVAGVILCLAIQTMTIGDMLPIALGTLIFFLINIAKVYLLQYQVAKISSMDETTKGKNFAIVQGVIRFALTAIGLVAAALLPRLPFLSFDNLYTLYAAIVGAFAWNIAVYILRFVNPDEDK